MARKFPDFLTAYLDYARDGFCPDKFHYWTGISIIAAALERKVWIIRDIDLKIFPNLYVFLLAAPGDGKSSAGNRGMSILKEVTHKEGPINFIPTKITDAALTEAMAKWKRFHVGPQEYTHASCYYYASEASNSLKEISGGGEIFAAMTEAYDCGEKMVKRTVKGGEQAIKNVCMNILSGCTFNYLKQLMPEENIMGGFASRFLYVVHDDKMIRTPKWDFGTAKTHPNKFPLIQDLQEIHHLTGQFAASPEYAAAFEAWFPKNDEARHAIQDERLQAFLARKHVNTMKLSMIFAVSEGNALELKLRHWDKALKTVEELEAKLPRIIDASVDKQSQEGINRMTMKGFYAAPTGEMTGAALRSHLLHSGVKAQEIEPTIEQMTKSETLVIRIEGAKTLYRIAVNPGPEAPVS